MQRLGPNSVDLGFIDADKDNYDSYYELLLKLVRPGGVIVRLRSCLRLTSESLHSVLAEESCGVQVVDNVLWGGSVIDPSNETPDTKVRPVILLRDIATSKLLMGRLDLQRMEKMLLLNAGN